MELFDLKIICLWHHLFQLHLLLSFQVFRMVYYGLTILFISVAIAQSINSKYNAQKLKICSKLLEILKGRNIDKMRACLEVITTTPEQPGCDFEGQRYPLNSEIYKGEDRASNWCYGAYCDTEGEIIYWDDFNCFPTTTPSPTTPPSTPTTIPFGCMYNGEFFPPGTEIERGEDRASNWCYGTICDDDGQILHWDNFDCFPTTTPTTQIPTTTTITTTTTTPAHSPSPTFESRRKRFLDILKQLVQ